MNVGEDRKSSLHYQRMIIKKLGTIMYVQAQHWQAEDDYIGRRRTSSSMISRLFACAVCFLFSSLSHSANVSSVGFQSMSTSSFVRLATGGSKAICFSWTSTYFLVHSPNSRSNSSFVSIVTPQLLTPFTNIPQSSEYELLIRLR